MNKIEKRAMTPHEAAKAYGISEGHLANLRCRRQGPKFYRVPPGNRKIVYLVSDLEDWIRSNPVLTSESID